MLEKTKQFCNSLLGIGLPGFDLAIYKDGECILRHMNGYSSLEKKTKLCGNERYNIYSCSKVITCTAALQLYEKGLFSLEDKLSQYMPEFEEMNVSSEGVIKRAEKPILIKHLFEMTAGFSYKCASPELKRAFAETNGRCQTREVMKYLAKEPLLFEPGDRWEYSLCHDVLAALVEVLSGEKFEEYVQKNIFAPLGMKDTTFMLPDNELDTLAEQYRIENGENRNIGKGIFIYKLGSEYASGGAGCISTVDDYIKFLEGLRTYKLLRPETIELMTTDRLTEYQKQNYWPKETHGYGLGVRCPKEGGEFVDFGWGGAACAYLSVDIANGLSIYFSAHQLSSKAQGLRGMVYRFALAELFNEAELENIYNDLEKIHNYTLTY